MRVYIGSTELWPVYEIEPGETDPDGVEVTQQELDRWADARRLFDTAQGEMRSRRGHE